MKTEFKNNTFIIVKTKKDLQKFKKKYLKRKFTLRSIVFQGKKKSFDKY